MIERLISPPAQPIPPTELTRIRRLLDAMGVKILAGYPLPLDPDHAARVLVSAARQVGTLQTLGGPGSGHFGHAGRPGQTGGSVSSSVAKPRVPRYTNIDDVSAAADVLEQGSPVMADPPVAAGIVKEMANRTSHVNLQLLQVTGEDNKNIFNAHARNHKRGEMPQLPEGKDEQLAFFKHLADNGVKMKIVDADPRQLMATQAELDSMKVGQIYSYLLEHGGKLRGETGPLFTSKEGYVVDGHHRWASVASYALTHPGTKVPVAMLDVDIDKALELSHAFSDKMGIARRGFAEPMPKAAAAFDDKDFEPIVIEPPPPGAPPKPDNIHPWNWINGRWIYIPTDSADGVPPSLDLPKKIKALTRLTTLFNPHHDAKTGQFTTGPGGEAWRTDPFNTSQPHYIGGDIPDTPRLPIFTTPDPEGAAWYARERSDSGTGKVHQISLDVKQPFGIHNETDVKKLLPILDEANVTYTFTPSTNKQGWWLEVPEVAKHSPYEGSNPVDVAYIPKVREVLVRHGYDALQIVDPLEHAHDIPITVLIKSPAQMRRIKTLAAHFVVLFNPHHDAKTGQFTSAPSGIMAAIQQADGGFTYHAVTGTQPTTGYALSLHKDRERVLDAKNVNLVTLAQYTRDNADLLTQTDNYLGGWHNPEDGKVYLDVSTIVTNAADAERLGRDAHQLAYFDLARGQSVTIGSSHAPEAHVEPDRPEARAAHARRLDRAGQVAYRSRSVARRDRASAPHSHPQVAFRPLFNPYHDPETGQFTSGPGGASPQQVKLPWSSSGSAGARPVYQVPPEKFTNPPHFEGEVPPPDVDSSLDPTPFGYRNTLKEPVELEGDSRRLGGGINESRIVSTDDGEFVFKPIEGESFSARAGTIDNEDAPLAEREVLAHRVDAELKLGLVPNTIMGEFEGRFGSFQEFIPHAQIGGEEADRSQLAMMGILDAVIGNTDRHGGNLLTDADGQLVAIDHGYSFGTTSVGGYIRSGPLSHIEDGDLSVSEQKMIATRLKNFHFDRVLQGSHLNGEEVADLKARVRAVANRLDAGEAHLISEDFEVDYF